MKHNKETEMIKLKLDELAQVSGGAGKVYSADVYQEALESFFMVYEYMVQGLDLTTLEGIQKEKEARLELEQGIEYCVKVAQAAGVTLTIPPMPPVPV